LQAEASACVLGLANVLFYWLFRSNYASHSG
jgi:hypothetical protein